MAADVDVRMWTLLLVTSLVTLFTTSGVTSLYWNYNSVTAFLTHYNSTRSDIVHLYTIGTSVQGRQLWVVALGASPRHHVMLRPEVKFVGNIHGNEAVSRDLLLRYIDYAIEAYGVEAKITHLLDTTRLHLLVSMNPDGFEEALNGGQEGQCRGNVGRFNAHGVDLNRNFPDYFEGNSEEVEIETAAVMAWLTQHQFVLSASLHGGALVANYPYDNYAGASKMQSNTPKASISPDDDFFQHMALAYSFSHPKMHSENPRSASFRNGTTNGAAWYTLKGGMQDYNYIYAGCMELTLELSNCKFPLSRELVRLWQENKQPLTQLWSHVHMGVKGIVSDALSARPVTQATVTVQGRLHGVNTTALGEYWRLLLPGTYRLEVLAAGYVKQEVEFNVVEGVVTMLNISLTPDSLITEPRTITLAADWQPTVEVYRDRPVVPSGCAVQSAGILSSVTCVLTSLLLQWCFISLYITRV